MSNKTHKFTIPRETTEAAVAADKVIITVVAFKNGTYAVYKTDLRDFYFSRSFTMPLLQRIIESEKKLVSEMVYFLFNEYYVYKMDEI
jgi:hypothetical protein